MSSGATVAGHDEFVTGRKQGDTRPAPYGEFGQADTGGQAQSRRRKALSGDQHGGAARHVLAGTTDPLARRWHAVHPQHGAAGDRLTILLHHHRIGTRGNRGAGEDACRTTRLHFGAHGAGRNALRDLQHGARLQRCLRHASA
jgi:hypothetical protein